MRKPYKRCPGLCRSHVDDTLTLCCMWPVAEFITIPHSGPILASAHCLLQVRNEGCAVVKLVFSHCQDDTWTESLCANSCLTTTVISVLNIWVLEHVNSKPTFIFVFCPFKLAQEKAALTPRDEL